MHLLEFITPFRRLKSTRIKGHSHGTYFPNSAEKTFTRIYQNNDKQEECNPIDNVVIPFSLRIPNVINKSYVARYSEYIWVLDFKINVPFSKDIHVREIIAIV